MNTIVTGNGGEVVINEDGIVVEHRPSDMVPHEHDGYGDIIRFDVVEWRAHYGRDLPSTIDILDIGYWYSGGPDAEVAYEPAEPDFRRPKEALK